MLPGNFTRGAKKLNGGDGGGDKERAGDNDAEVTYFSAAAAARDVVDEGDVIAARVAEEVRSVNPSLR